MEDKINNQKPNINCSNSLQMSRSQGVEGNELTSPHHQLINTDSAAQGDFDVLNGPQSYNLYADHDEKIGDGHILVKNHLHKEETDNHNPQCDDGQNSLSSSTTIIPVQPALKQSEIRGGAGGDRETLEALTEESPLKTEATESPSPTVKKSIVKAKANHYNDPLLVMNICYTQYELVHEIAQTLHLRTSIDEEEDWDIWFIDGPTIPALLTKMKSHQRTNHFPGMYALARKNLLAKNLIQMQKYFPKEYAFFPKTWLLPADIKSFKDQFNFRKAKTFIVKPEASCQGKGIFLTRNADFYQVGEHYVAQRYLHKPFLIDNLKFDLRIYVLITSVIPLRIFIYHEGLARFATQEYVSPIGSNLNNLCMHLTNYAINKESEDFVQNSGGAADDSGHKRSLSSIFKSIELARQTDPEIISSEECWQQLKELTVKTIISGHNQIAHIQKTAKPQDLENQLCFQILGIDIFLDKKAKPWLIEVNQSPSFMTDSPLDHQVKKGCLVDSMRMLNLSWRRKNRYINNARIEKQRRLQGLPRASNFEKEESRQKKIRIKDKHELNNLGGYERIYPVQPEHLRDNEYNIALQDRYDELIHHSQEIWNESTSGGYSKKKVLDPLAVSKLASKSPDKLNIPKELTKKESSISNNTIQASTKKTTFIKLNSMSSEAGGNQILSQIQNKREKAIKVVAKNQQVSNSVQPNDSKDQKAASHVKVMQLKDRTPIKNTNLSTYDFKNTSDIGMREQHNITGGVASFQDRQDSDSGFVITNHGKQLESIQSQRNRSLQKQIGEQMVNIHPMGGEDRLVNDFKQMQVEMRAMISGTNSPEKVPIKIKQYGPVLQNDQLLMKNIQIDEPISRIGQSKFQSPNQGRITLSNAQQNRPAALQTRPNSLNKQKMRVSEIDNQKVPVSNSMKYYMDPQQMSLNHPSTTISPMGSHHKTTFKVHQSHPASNNNDMKPPVSNKTLTYFPQTGPSSIRNAQNHHQRTDVYNKNNSNGSSNKNQGRNDQNNLVDYHKNQPQIQNSQLGRRLGNNNSSQKQHQNPLTRQTAASQESGDNNFNKQRIATVAMSAQTNLNHNRVTKLQGVDGLHVTKDPDSIMTHSAAFDNYKRHVKAQQSYWYMQQSQQPNSKEFTSSNLHPQQQQQTVEQNNYTAMASGSTQRSLSNAVATAAQNISEAEHLQRRNETYELAKNHKVQHQQQLILDQKGGGNINQMKFTTTQGNNTIDSQKMEGLSQSKIRSSQAHARKMLPPAHSYSRSSQQEASTKVSQGIISGEPRSSAGLSRPHKEKNNESVAVQHISSTGKIVNRMNISSQAQQLGANVFSPLANPNPLKSYPQNSSAKIRSSIQQQRSNAIQETQKAQQRLSHSNNINNGFLSNNQQQNQGSQKSHHQGLPGPRKTTVEKLYENKLHLQKQNQQQFQSSFVSTIGDQHHNSRQTPNKPSQSIVHGVSSSQQQPAVFNLQQQQQHQQQQQQVVIAPTSAASQNANNQKIMSAAQMRSRATVQLRQTVLSGGEHLVLQGLSIQKGSPVSPQVAAATFNNNSSSFINGHRNSNHGGVKNPQIQMQQNQQQFQHLQQQQHQQQQNSQQTALTAQKQQQLLNNRNQ